MDKLKLFFSTLAVSAILTGCGGGGGSGVTGPTYTGVTTPAAITSSNAETLSTKSVNATQEAIVQNAANDANPFAISITQVDDRIHQRITEISRMIASSTTSSFNLPLAATVSYLDLNFEIGYDLFCGGYVSGPNDFGSSGFLNGTLTFNNLCINDSYFGSITMNGSIIFRETATTFSMQYVNVTISYAGESITVNMTFSCGTSGCSISTDFVGTDGSIYRIADLDIWGFGTGPFDIDATFYHPDHGSVIISGTGIEYNCINSSYPSTGSITITGAGGSYATISFDSCIGYSGSWFDGITTDNFNGSWL